MKLVPHGTRVFFSLLFVAPLSCNQADTSGELTEYDVFEQRMIVSPTETQAGPAPTVVSPDQAPPAADRTQEAIAEEVEIRKEILNARETRFVAAGTVVAKKAFLFENPPELWTAGERNPWGLSPVIIIVYQYVIGAVDS